MTTPDGPPGSDGESLSGGHYRLGAALTTSARTARDTWDDRDVVALALAPDGDAAPPSPDALTRVARDVRRVSEHPHPGLAPARDVAAAPDRRLWLVHDVPAGARGLPAGDPLPAAVLLHHADVLAGALAAAHAARLVHGSIGPAMVLTGPEGPWLLGAPSGVRPTDRPAAEDDDTRALATTLAGVPLADDTELGERLGEVLAATARAHPATPGTVGAALRDDLRALVAALPDEERPAGRPGDAAPVVEDVPVRRTEVISTAGVTERWSPARPAPAHSPDAPDAPAVERSTTPVGVLASPAPPARPAPRPPGRARPAGWSGPGRPGPVPGGPRPGGPVTPPSPGPPHPADPPGSRRTGLVIAAVAVLVVVLLGVVLAAVLAGGGDGPGDEPGDRVVPAVIGDARTAEPCGLVDPAALAPGGRARVVPDLGSPAACTVDVVVPAGETVVVATLEPVATAVGAAPEERVGSLLVRRPTPQRGLCSRTVVTTEGVQVALDAAAPPGSSADPCVAADAATAGTVRALTAGTPLPRRASADPPGALTAADTCALLGPDDLAAVPGLDPARTTPGVGGWSCRWGAGTVVDVGIERRRTFTASTRLGGRPATVTPRDGSCDAALAQRAYTAVDGTPRVELLEVTVFGTRPVDALCADATRLAAATVPRLPAP